MKLLTKANLKALPPLYSQDGKGEDALAQVKFFTPWSNWTWYASEYDPATRTFFGVVEGPERELGYFQLDELASVTGPWGLAVERDLHFKPTPLKDCTMRCKALCCEE